MAIGKQGRSDGGLIGIYTPAPKSAQVNSLWGKMTSERLFIQQFYTSPPQKKKLLYPQNKFLATPLLASDAPWLCDDVHEELCHKPSPLTFNSPRDP